MDIFRCVLLLLLVAVERIKGKDFIRACYFTNWSLTKPNPDSRYSIIDIDPFLCTHLVYAFANLEETYEITAMTGDDSISNHVGNYAKFNNIKKKNDKLKTLLSVGGANAHAQKFIKLTSQEENVKIFAKKAAKFLRDRDFDGLDIDWEFPDKDSKSSFTKLLRIVSEEFKKEAQISGKPQLLLTIAVSAGYEKIEAGYDKDLIKDYVDYIFIMAYDFFGSWSKVTGFNSPLYPRNSNRLFSPKYNVEFAVNTWRKGGIPKEKIVVGMTGAGCSFTLNSTEKHDVGDLVDGPGKIGRMYGLPARLVFPEICYYITGGWKSVWDDEQKVPYAYSGNQWVGYDNVKSIRIKVEWMLAEKLGGAMFWELGFDDFSGKFCSQGKYPMLNAVKKAVESKLGNPTQPTVTTVDPNVVLPGKGGVSGPTQPTVTTVDPNVVLPGKGGVSGPTQPTVTNLDPNVVLPGKGDVSGPTQPTVTTVDPNVVLSGKGGVSGREAIPSLVLILTFLHVFFMDV